MFKMVLTDSYPVATPKQWINLSGGGANKIGGEFDYKVLFISKFPELGWVFA